MTSTVTLSDTATSTSYLALTTPFEPPRGCDSNWKTTSAPNGATVLVSENVKSCMPSGWEGGMAFSPAVCPSGWVYNYLNNQGASMEAYCCQSDYTFRYPDPNEGYDFDIADGLVPTRCGRWVDGKGSAVTRSSQSDENGNESIETTVDSETTLMLHEAWIVGWTDSDTPTLTPKMPTLTQGRSIETWKPGDKIPEPAGTFPKSLLWFLIVGLPIIGAFGIGLCVWACVRRCRKKRRATTVAKADVGHARDREVGSSVEMTGEKM